MTEHELQEHVRVMCAQLGLYHYHTHDSRRSQAGFPDSFIMNYTTGKVLYRELKNNRGDRSRAQRVVAYGLLAGGHDYSVWRPADLTSGRIARELVALAGKRIAA